VIEVFFNATMMAIVTIMEVSNVVISLIIPSGSDNLTIYEIPQPAIMAIAVLAI
jgi:hypothetical protein